MRRNQFIVLSIGLLIIAGAVFGAWFGLKPSDQTRYYADVVEALSGDQEDENFEKVVEIIDFKMPNDLGPHPTFQTEWWYYTGNLTDENERHFGYQLTVFRRSLSSTVVDTESDWRTNQVYFAHFAVTDVKEEAFYSFERFSRDVLGLAGATAKPLRVWIENWQIKGNGDRVNLYAQEKGVSIDFSLLSKKPMVLQGEKGLSRKGDKLGNASYYFSLTRIETQGVIKIDGQKYNVEGYSWLDREWSTQVLQKGDRGWDWFSLQFEDDRELMVFHLRSENGGISPFSSGSIAYEDGTTRTLYRDDFSIIVTERWKSPDTGVTYPAGWEISVPSENLNFKVIPFINNQEHLHSFLYWEGAIKIVDSDVNGTGYAELTGYLP